ncbi:indolepyruvate decarboxylase [Rhizobium sp. BK313]|uniref:alpha-keto acid decarboxylase family protein n=1 Tax=Rhizobium sp. BK313 TaxID=2587081 RepID=UPI001061504C|nr:thiamine pyrophosphate-dependent enzyme [Rhizobium sp. BK313]MBB3457338.1 indolepyruvate decarboxylase [Rhizobium sp. BK313]
MGEKFTVGQYMVDRLHELGLRHLFSIAGDYSIEWVNSYVEKSPIRVIEDVNELNAGYAADGYARLNGIGALCVTYSAGALCATNAIAGSYVEKVPVVLINGAPSIKKTLTFEQTGYSSHHFISGRETDLQVFEYITAAAVRIDSPHLAPMLIDYALTQCITERRPVYIELLEDMVDLECARPLTALKPAPVMSDEDSLNQSITQISERLQNATKPLIWIGVEIDRFGLHDQAERLIRDLKIPYVTELLSKSILSEDDAQFAGVFDGKSSSPYVQSLVKDSDFVLALGVWLTDINDLGWPIDFEKTAFASWDTLKYGASFEAQVSLADLVNGLIDKRLTCKTQSFPAKTAPQAPAVNLADGITYQGFYDFIQHQIDGNTIVGADASLNYFGSILLKVGARRGFIVQSSYSAIGYIGPAATGVSLAKQDKQRLMVFSGDGGFQMTAQCLSTQTRFNLNPIIFVMDNGVYGVEQWLADASVFHGNTPFYNSCNLHRWNYSKLAEVFGCRGWEVHTYGELEEAVNGAKENLNSPSIIQVVVPQRSIPDNANWKAN